MSIVLDPKAPPRLDAALAARLDAIGDEDIDYSDIQELDEAFWAKAKVPAPC